ncbi:hypothetical protein [Mixta mediterraneensis]|uniref:hypothetical protein n=1 Tax=Mixta mediterraneensis TaxID=2758443 RepID=UPI0018756226|nr:hypothetical protein [Mixta mediterraneensis]MBE5254699.1 hypothetical protein [Mixta mediterraneensis]
MKIFINDKDGNLIPAEGKSVVFKLDNGQTLEISPEYTHPSIPEGINIWGGREPEAAASFAEKKKEALSLAVYPVAANAIHVSPYRLSDENAVVGSDAEQDQASL